MNTDQDQNFTSFSTSIERIPLPTAFTFPFYYEPHPLSVLASQQLQLELEQNTDWNHDFGVDESIQVNSGKMFGVLVVQKPTGEIGFLKGFSGKLANTPNPKGFVPHIYDMMPEHAYFDEGMKNIHDITIRIQEIESLPDFESKAKDLEALRKRAQWDIESEKSRLKSEKAERLAKRTLKKEKLSADEYQKLSKALDEESVRKKFYIKHLNNHWEDKIERVTLEINAFYEEYEKLKTARKQGSIDLQQQIFAHYSFNNALGETSNL